MNGKIALTVNRKETVRQAQLKLVATAACKPAQGVVDGKVVKVMVAVGVHVMNAGGSSVSCMGIFRPNVRREVTPGVLKPNRSVIQWVCASTLIRAWRVHRLLC